MIVHFSPQRKISEKTTWPPATVATVPFIPRR